MENEENNNDIEAQNKKTKVEEDFQKKLEHNQFKIMTTFKKNKKSIFRWNYANYETS